jgi:diketogulonate reductase-like aldo/keto reductase
MSLSPTISLRHGVSPSGGVEMPQLGLGTARAGDEEVRRNVLQALDVGYRLIDTAARYDNEVGVGRGIADSGLPREDIFVTTKLRGAEQGSATAKQALDASLRRLGLDYVDLFLIHWPLPGLDKYVESWHAMEELLGEGKARAIGVSNFLPVHLDRLAAESGTVPAVNQIELHPRLPQADQRGDHARRGIVTQAWAPLAMAGEVFGEPALRETADKHGRTPAQVVLRWHVQQGLSAVPKSSHADRLRENLDLFDFELDAEDMTRIAGLDTGQRLADQDPATYEEY